MMKFRAIAIPEPTVGIDYSKEVDQLVPDQSLSLREILERFTRGEAVPVGHDGHYGEDEGGVFDVDLEKMAHADLVDKEEFGDKLRDVKKRHEVQEAAKVAAAKKASAEAAKKAEEKRVRIAARKLAKGNSGQSNVNT